MVTKYERDLSSKVIDLIDFTEYDAYLTYLELFSIAEELGEGAYPARETPIGSISDGIDKYNAMLEAMNSIWYDTCWKVPVSQGGDYFFGRIPNYWVPKALSNVDFKRILGTLY